MLYRTARLLQLAGLLILPQAIVLELLEHVSLRESLAIALAGVVVFLLGVGLQRTSGREQ
jgi:hypothetical protein